MRVALALDPGPSHLAVPEARWSPEGLAAAERFEGTITLSGEGQPDLVIRDDLFAAVQAVCFASLVALVHDRAEVYLYRHLAAPAHLALVPLGPDRVSWFGERSGAPVPPTSWPAPVYWPMVLAAGERFVAAVTAAFGADDPRVAELLPWVERAKGALGAAGFARVGATSVPPARPPPPPTHRHRFVEWVCCTARPADAGPFYREVVGPVRGVRFAPLVPAAGGPQWLGTVGGPDPDELGHRLRVAGAGAIGPVTEPLWVDPCGAVVRVGADGLAAGPSALLYTPAPARLAALFGDAFGWTADGSTLRSGDVVIAHLRRPPDPSLRGWWPLFEVADLEDALATALALGATAVGTEAGAVLLRDPLGGGFGLTADLG